MFLVCCFGATAWLYWAVLLWPSFAGVCCGAVAVALAATAGSYALDWLDARR